MKFKICLPCLVLSPNSFEKGIKEVVGDNTNNGKMTTSVQANL